MDASELPAEEEKLSVRIRRQYMARLIGLSDGVFAIAITLSALEIHMPYTESDRIETILMELFPVLTP